MLLIVAFTMRVVRQPIMVADQITVNIDGSLDRAAVRPRIFAETRLNAELTFDQTLPRSAFVVKMMRDAEPPICLPEGVTRKLRTVIGNDGFPRAPPKQSRIIKPQHDAEILATSERTGENRPR